jgi:hypothetical protein
VGICRTQPLVIIEYPPKICAFGAASAGKQSECAMKRVSGLKNAEEATGFRKSPGADNTKGPSASFCIRERKGREDMA